MGITALTFDTREMWGTYGSAPCIVRSLPRVCHCCGSNPLTNQLATATDVVSIPDNREFVIPASGKTGRLAIAPLDDFSLVQRGITGPLLEQLAAQLAEFNAAEAMYRSRIEAGRRDAEMSHGGATGAWRRPELRGAALPSEIDRRLRERFPEGMAEFLNTNPPTAVRGFVWQSIAWFRLQDEGAITSAEVTAILRELGEPRLDRSQRCAKDWLDELERRELVEVDELGMYRPTGMQSNPT